MDHPSSLTELLSRSLDDPGSEAAPPPQAETASPAKAWRDPVASSEILDRLMEAARHPSPAIRAAALRALGEAGAHDALALLLQALTSDADAAVRMCAIEALDCLAGHEVWEALVRLPPDEDLRVRWKVERALLRRFAKQATTRPEHK